MEDSTNGTKTFSTTSILNESFVDDDCIIREGEETQRDFLHFFIYGICLNSIGILGLIGNVISITILSRPNMRSSINCCLVGLASFDAILLTSSLLMFGIPAIPEYTGAIMWYQRDVFPWITLAAYPLGTIAQTGSVYLTVTVTVERYVAVCHPLKARSLCTYGRAKIYVISVALFSILYNLPRFWEVTYKYCGDDFNGFTTVVMTEMRKQDSYIQIYITWLYLVVMYLVPFLSLLVFNIFIYKQVRLANHERQRLSRLQKKELGLAVMLLCVVIVFFLCNILALIVNVLEMYSVAIAILTSVNNLLVNINSSVNFIIYCIFGQKFRRLFFQIFCFGALSRAIGGDGPLLESGVGGVNNNSVYGEGGGRLLANGRSTTQTRSIRLSSWSGSHAHRVNSVSWQGGSVGGGGGRSIMSVMGQPNQYRNVPLQETSGRNGGTLSTKADPSVFSPSTDPLVEKDEKSDIV